MFLLAILLHSCAVPSAMAAFATGASMQEEDTQICPGDINLDGERGPGDLALLSAHIAGEKILEGEALDNADVNFDFVVDVGDIIRLQEHILGEFPLAPCGDFSPLEVACPGVSLERPSALPLERVGLGTLPEEFSEPTLALVTDTEDELSVLTYVKPEEDGSVTLFTPFYPGASAASGPVKLQITDGTLACPPADFLIEAMPPAPGAYSNVVDALQEMIRVNAQESGLTPQDLLAGNAELPPEAIPLAIAQALVDDPDNPNSLRAISNGTAPFMDGNADNTFLDSSVALLGLAGYVGGDSQAFQSLRQASLVGPSAICGASASLLDGCMKSAAAAEKKLNPPDPGPAVKKLREDFAMTLAAAKFLPRVGKTIKYTHILINHIVKKIKNLQMIALPLAIGKWTAEAKASLLPSILVDLDFEVSPSVMEEDRVEGEWKNSELTAMSKGWKLDARRIAKYALDKLDVKEGLTGGTVVAARKIAEYNGILPHDISNRELEKQLVDLVVEKGREVAPEIFNGESVFEIQPQTSGPVKIDDEEWSRSDVMGVSVAKLSHNKFEPAKVGSATIIVRVRTDGGRFGGAGSISKGKAVEVRQIIMTVSPHQAIARKPGEELPFTVTVKNSFFPKQIKVEALTGSARIKSSNGNQHEVTYTAPSLSQLPDKLIATHTATTGARKSGEPRIGVADIRAKPYVLVLPEKDCVDPSEAIEITHSVEGVSDQRVVWELARLSGSGSAGSISQSGRYTAPSTPGLVQITATSVFDSEAKGGATVKVGGCDCWWSVSIGGGTVFGVPGEDKGTFFVESGNFVTGGLDHLQGGALQFAPAQPGSIPVLPGNYFFSVNGSIGLSQPDFLYATAEDSPLLGVFTEFGEFIDGAISPTILEGYIDGPVTILKSIPTNPENPVEERTGQISIRFRIFADPQFPFGASCFVE